MSGVKKANGHRLDGVLPIAQTPMPGPHPTQEDVGFDLEPTLAAIRPLRSSVPPDCHSAATLGTEREGSAILLDETGIFLTIGYLIVEATDVLIGGTDGDPIDAQCIGYDHETGFGLVRTVEPLDIPPIKIAPNIATVQRDSPVVVISHGGVEQSLLGNVADRRLFAGSWEYMLESAIFTYPLHPHWSGGAVVDREEGHLVGVGSLFVQGVGGSGGEDQGNMFVPIDELKPILADLLRYGRRAGPRRPWIGAHTYEENGRIFVSRISKNGPADKAGLTAGDLILGVNGSLIQNQEDFYRKLWHSGKPGKIIKLKILPKRMNKIKIQELNILSGDRSEWLKLKRDY